MNDSNETDTNLTSTQGLRASAPAEIALMLIIMIVTIVGNSSVCWIIFTNPKLHTVPNKLVLNLAWCDLLTAVVNGPITVVVLFNGSWIMGDPMCQINGFTTTLFGIASVLTLAVISLNRCCMIVYSTKYAFWFSNSKTNIMITGLWLFSAVCAFPPVAGWSHYVYIPGKAICTLIWSTNISYTLFVLTFGIMAPFFIMIISYYKIFKVVQNNARRIKSHFSRRSAPPSPVSGHPDAQNSLKSSGEDGAAPQGGNEYKVSHGQVVRLNSLFRTPLDNEDFTQNRRASNISIVSRSPSFFEHIYGDIGRRPSNISMASGTDDRPPTAISGRIGREGSSRKQCGQGPRVEDVKITKTVLIVLLAFVVCWAPISVVNFLETFFNYEIPLALDLFTVYMVFLNCALNPIIYGMMNRNFRKGFQDIFCICKNARFRRQRSVGAVIAIHSVAPDNNESQEVVNPIPHI